METTKLYIGISGKMGSGKSTIKDEIINALVNYKCETVSLATPIKNVEKLIYNELNIEHTKKDRELLIKLGTWGRDKDPDFWLNQAVKLIESSDADIVICDDVRFENEAKWFDKNGMLIRLNGAQRGDNVNPEFANNITETALDDYSFKYTVNNQGSVEDTTVMALYCIAQHVGVTEQIMERAVKEVNDGRQEEKENNS